MNQGANLYETAKCSLLSLSSCLWHSHQLITAFLFHGVTSSGSAYFVQLLAQTPLGITLSCILVQLFSEYIDRLFSLYLCERLIQRLPSSLRRNMIRSDESTQ
ncbi:MAG: hypothetical protein HFE68_04190 [Erysipelotrichaceae bacterium]|nr:hypothetical protein [Erysipelotrichaceae bacterium]